MQTTQAEGSVNTENWKLRLLSILFPRTSGYAGLGLLESKLKTRPRQLWLLAQQVLMDNLPTPPLHDTNEICWVERAVAFLDSPSEMRCGSRYARAIGAAWDLEREPETRVPLMAALLAKGGAIAAVAAVAHLDPLVVEAFSVLFFNRKSRRWGLRKKVVRDYLIQQSRTVQRPDLTKETELLTASLRGNLGDVISRSRRLSFRFFESPTPG